MFDSQRNGGAPGAGQVQQSSPIEPQLTIAIAVASAGVLQIRKVSDQEPLAAGNRRAIQQSARGKSGQTSHNVSQNKFSFSESTGGKPRYSLVRMVESTAISQR